MSKMKKWITAFAVLSAIGAITYVLMWSRIPRGIDVKTATVKRGDMSTSLSTSGTIQSEMKRDYFASNPSKVTRVYVRVGDSVGKNELMVKLDVPDCSVQLKQAYIQLDIAKTTLQGLKNKKQYSDDLQAIPVSSDISTPSAGLDDQIKLQEKQVQIAELNVKSIKDSIYNTQSEILSDIEGIVTAVNVSEGGIASAGMPVITVEDTKDVNIVLNISQYDALKIKKGQDAVMHLGYDGKSYKGVVAKINPVSKKAMMGVNSETVVPVEVDLYEPDGDIKIGYDTEVEITTGVRKNVLYIPYECVMKDKENHIRVYKVENGKAVLKDVSIGVESDFYVEIIDGLKQGENVILNPSQEIKNGSKVTVK